MEKKLNIILKPTDIQFTEKCIEIVDSHIGSCRIPYEDIVMSGLRIYDRELKDWYEPEITEITRDMEGDLVFLDSRGCRWVVYTELMEKTAEALLSELVMHAPHILVGRQTWIDLEDEDSFSEASSMVDLMRRC